mgnify:CR=1 FL=1
MPFCTIHLNVRRSNVDFHELGKVLQRFFRLFPVQKRSSVERFGGAIVKWLTEPYATCDIVTVFVEIADGFAE